MMPPIAQLNLASAWLDRLLGLSGVSWGDAAARLAWAHPLPRWGWVLVGLAAVGVAVWSYAGVRASVWVRVWMGALRAMAVVAVVVLIAGPELVRTDERTEPDVVVLLVDRSASMGVEDEEGEGAQVSRRQGAEGEEGEEGEEGAEGGGFRGGRISRDEAVRGALAGQGGVFGDAGFLKDREVVWLGFAEGVYPIDPPTFAASMGPATGRGTRLRTAIESGLASASGRPVAGVVVLSDGRTPQATGPDLVRRLESLRVPVFSVLVGADRAVLDVSVSRVEAPREAFIGDAVPVNVTVEQTGDDTGGGRVRVRLIEVLEGGEVEVAAEGAEGLTAGASEGGEGDEGGRVLDERVLTAEELGRPVRLEGKQEAPGRARWRVEAERLPDVEGGPRVEEPIRQNNSRLVEVDVVDRPIRVLYVEGYPRWEYRYLKNLLIREDSISASTLLLSADRAFAQEGDVPITRFPATGEELNQYDVVILGDFPPALLGEEALGLLREQVAARGTGLLWIGGSRDTPVAWAESSLAALLPMREPGAVRPMLTATGAIHVEPTQAARALGVLELIEPAGYGRDEAGDVAEPRDGVPALWPTDLPPLLWAQDLGPLKPSAEVLAEVRPDAPPAAEAAAPGDASYIDAAATVAAPPVLTRLRYGGGQSLYLGTDETWRWRYGKGDPYFDQFWIGLVRTLGRARVQLTGDGAALLQVRPRQLQLGDTAIVELTLSDPSLIERNLPGVRVVVTPLDAASPNSPAATAPIDQLDLRLEAPPPPDPSDPDAAVSLNAPLQLTYRAAWLPTASGELRLAVDEPALAGLDLTATATVIAPDDELRQPQSDHPRLIQLAADTGGQVIPLNDLQKLIDAIPHRPRKTAHDTRAPIWDSALALIVVLVLLALEWTTRRLIRLP